MKRQEPAASSEVSIHTARLTLEQWLLALERAEILKPGATTRILKSRKLTRIALPKIPVEQGRGESGSTAAPAPSKRLVNP